MEAEKSQYIDSVFLSKEHEENLIELFKSYISEEDVIFFQKIIKDNPNGVWATAITELTPMGYHFFGGGMQVRNFFRQNGYSESNLGIANLDNIYVDIIEKAIATYPK